MKSVINKLSAVQAQLRVPKNQFNAFGKYKYRSCEDILEAAKPLLAEHGLVLTISDDVKQLEERFYIQSTATLICIETGECMTTTAVAREPDQKKGADESQVTGATSSYCRKYLLNGLFLIDDTKDADATNQHEPAKSATKAEPLNVDKVLKALNSAKSKAELVRYYETAMARATPEQRESIQFVYDNINATGAITNE
jgi:hypothetical protein